MPRKTQKAENEAVSTPASEEKMSEQVKATPKARTRTMQPKVEEETACAPKPRTRTAQVKKEGETHGGSKPRAKKTEADGVTDREAPLSQAEKTPKPARKRTATGEKQSPEKPPEPTAENEAEAPAGTSFFPVLQAPETALPVQADAPRELEIAVPPVAFPLLRGERRRFWIRMLFLLMVGALISLSALILAYRPTRYSSYSHSVVFLYHADRDTTQVLYDGAVCAEEIAGKCVRSERDSAGSTCAALIGDTLYLVRGDDVLAVSADVLDFTLSQNGRVLCYRTADQKLLYARTGRVLKTSTVSADTRDARYCLSPDGELLFYTYAVQNGEDEVKIHADVFSLSGDKPFLPRTTDMIPVAIADDYEHLFYFNTAGDLYYMDEAGTTSLCRRKGEGEMTLLFDREFEEVLIKDADGVALWQEGDLTVIPQLKGAENLSLLADKLAVYRSLPCATQCLVRSLDENYYLKKGSDAQGVELVYLENDTLHSVAFVDESESKIAVTQKGVYYLDREVTVDEVRKHLYRCPIGQTTPVRLSLDVADFLTNSDGSRLLHADHRGAVYTSRVVGDALDSDRICDVSEPNSLRVNASNAFYYIAEDMAYMSDNGREPVAVKENPGVIYTDVYTTFFFIAEEADEDGSVNYTVYTNHRNRRESKKVATGVTALS